MFMLACPFLIAPTNAPQLSTEVGFLEQAGAVRSSGGIRLAGDDLPISAIQPVHEVVHPKRRGDGQMGSRHNDDNDHGASYYCPPYSAEQNAHIRPLV